MPTLSEDQLARLVQDFYATVLERENDGRLLSQGPLPEEIRKARLSFYADVAGRSKQDLATSQFASAWFVTQAMLRKQGIPDGLDPKEIRRAQQAVLRAGIDLAEAMKARYAGDFNYEPKDKLLQRRINHLFAQAEQPSPSPEPEATAQKRPEVPVTFSALARSFCQEQLEGKLWERQTAQQARKTYKLFVELCSDKPLKAYSRKDAIRFKDTLQLLPADYGKAAAYRGLNLAEIIAKSRASESEAPRLSPRTVKRHVSAGLVTLGGLAVICAAS